MDTEFHFTLKSVSWSKRYVVAGDDGSVDGFVAAFLPLFEGYDPLTVTLQPLQYNNVPLQARLHPFILEFEKKWPTLNGVTAFLRKLGPNQPFLLIPEVGLSAHERMLLHDALKSVKEGKDFQQLHNESKALFGELLIKYKIRVFGRERCYVGENDKNKRTCRFCNKTTPFTSFNNRAHALSEAIGNKNLILFDECDGCNDQFNKTIEGDLVAYFSFFRTFYGIKGKNGDKTLTGKDFTLKHSGKLVLSFGKGFAYKDADNEESFSLEITSRYAPQNIYKMLCKYFISLIPTEAVAHFSETIHWINGDKTVEKLPPIAVLFSDVGFKKHPQLSLYLRQDIDTTLPFAVGEFSVATFRFVFIVPFGVQDDRTFTEQADFDHFWKTFRHFNKAKGWCFEDFSSFEKKDYLSVLHIQKKDQDGHLTAPALFNSPSLDLGNSDTAISS